MMIKIGKRVRGGEILNFHLGTKPKVKLKSMFYLKSHAAKFIFKN